MSFLTPVLDFHCSFRWYLLACSWLFWDLVWNKSESVNHHYLTESANVLISKCPWRVSKWQGWLKLANVWVSKCLGPVRCLFSQQMSGLQMLNWHMSGQRLNFPAFELFDETFSKFIFSWKSRLKTWRVSPLRCI